MSFPPTTGIDVQRAFAGPTLGRFRSHLKCSLREPLLHFLLIGALLFGIYAYQNHGLSGAEPSKHIVLSLDNLRVIEAYYESQWQRPPTPQEFQAMVEDNVREEVLYREGLAMGLDKDDTIVKRRMAQKVQFLAEDVAAAYEPSTVELRAWFDKNKETFALPSRYSFRHLYFSPDTRGKNAREEATKALAKVAQQPEDSKLASSLADQFMFQDHYNEREPSAVAKEFGHSFAVALEKIKLKSWQGPIQSGYGWHLVFVDSVIPGRIPAFEEIESDVKTAWLGEQKHKGWEKAYAEMRAKYTVSLAPAPSEDTKAQKPRQPPPKTQAPSEAAEAGPF